MPDLLEDQAAGCGSHPSTPPEKPRHGDKAGPNLDPSAAPVLRPMNLLPDLVEYDETEGYRLEQDPTGLLNEGMRYRDPSTGTFLTRDPLGFKAGLNQYTYVRQNPWTHFDPEGLDWQNVAGGLKAAGGVLETIVGGSLVAAGAATSEFGVGIAIAAAGVAVTAHGVDTTQAGLRQAATGQPVDTLTSTALQKAGMSKTAANVTDTVIGVVGSAGAGVATGAMKVAAAKATEEMAGMTTTQILKTTETGSKALPGSAYKAIGGDAATTAQKAAAIKSGAVPGTGGIHPAVATGLFLKGTGLTPGAALGGGPIGGALQSSAAAITSTTAPKPSVAPSPTSSARTVAPPTPAPKPPPPPPKQNS